MGDAGLGMWETAGDVGDTLENCLHKNKFSGYLICFLIKGNDFRLLRNTFPFQTLDWNFHLTLIFLCFRLWKLDFGQFSTAGDVLDPQAFLFF